jgi:hypothetical protein
MGKQVPARTDAPLHRLPGLIVNDPESFHHHGFPFLRNTPAIYLPAGLGVLPPLATVEVEPADIFGVLQHEINRVGTPDSSSETSVQVLRDRLFPSSVAEAFKDLAYDRGLLENYGEAIADGYGVPARVSAAGRFIDWLGSIPIRAAPCRVALEELTIEAALGRFAEVVEVEFVDQALDCNADLRGFIAAVKPV